MEEELRKIEIVDSVMLILGLWQKADKSKLIIDTYNLWKVVETVVPEAKEENTVWNLYLAGTRLYLMEKVSYNKWSKKEPK